MGIDGEPRTAVVIGAGMVGLSTAWFLRERGVDVTVVDRGGVAAGSSWGNAGWLSPGLAIPLNEPGVLRYGLSSLLNPNAPLHVPATPDPALWGFLTRFALHCRWKSWNHAVQAGIPLNEECLEAFDVLTSNGVEAPTIDAPIMAAFETERQAAALLRELQRINESGLKIDYTAFTGDQLGRLMPPISPRVRAGIRPALHRSRGVHALTRPRRRRARRRDPVRIPRDRRASRAERADGPVEYGGHRHGRRRRPGHRRLVERSRQGVGRPDARARVELRV